MSNQSIILHLDRRWYDALARQLKKEDMTVEEKLDEYLDAMIDRLPERTREKISREIWEAQRFSVLRVTQDGGTDCVRLEDPESMGALRAAAALRDHLRPKRDPLRPPQRFARSVCGEELTPELFQAYAGELGQDTGRVTAVLDIDLDRGEFSILDAAGDWKTYAVSDVCTAAWLSLANSNGSLEWRLDTFAKHLEVAADLRQSKEIAPAGRLSDKQIVFSDEISEIGGRLNFYIDTGFDVDAVFGTHVCTGENDDCLNIYAEYDMAAGQVCDGLEVDLHRADGREESIPYTLNDAEKAMLLHKMEAYCLEQTGMTLRDYSAQLMAESAETVRPLSVFRVTQDGRTDHLLAEGDAAMDTLHAALRLRAYLIEKGSGPQQFAETLPAVIHIAPEVFCDYADEMRQGTGRVTAALDVDLDRGIFSTMAGADGWQTYTVSDVLAAAWNATIPHWSDWEARRCVFAEQLEDKLIDQESTSIAPPTGLIM